VQGEGIVRTPLACLNLAHHKMRTLVAVAGVAFAVVLIFLQLGFLAAAVTGATLVYDALDFDVLIRSKTYLHLVSARSLPRQRLYQAESSPGVAAVRPLHVASHYWRHPRDGTKRLILMLGVRPGDPAFHDPELQAKLARLTAPEFVLIDRRSRPEFGPRNGKRFGPEDVGVEAEVAGHGVRIVETFSMGTGFAADGAIVLSDAGLCRAVPGQSMDRVSFGLVKLADGARPDEVAAALRRALPPDVDVLTRRQVLDGEINHWVWEMSIGVIFVVGVAVALVVGTAIVYQVLASDVTNHLPEYATLKAIGYGDGFLSRVVLGQAVALAVLGFLPGALGAVALYAVTAAWTRLPISMTASRLVFVLALAVAMCAASGLGALRKVRTADPADLF
jgi:putative ABC transport system permease protein